MNTAKASTQRTNDVILKVLEDCQRNDWAGYDPYDALNSELFRSIRLLDSRIPRIAFTQVLKRSPINLRPILRIPKTHNPKAIALLLMAIVRLLKLGLIDEALLVDIMIQKLIDLRSVGKIHYCWGYSFPWQTRGLIVPRGAPSLVCTVFAANALLDVYDMRQDPRCLVLAQSAAEYIMEELYWSNDDCSAGFAYPAPSNKIHVHNSNLLCSALLCRIHYHSKERRFLDAAIKVARYSASKQNPDGSWYYGELSTQKWIDNFHTGYNLVALKDVGEYGGTSEFRDHIDRGLRFYTSSFFAEDGAPKYFHDSLYPIDIHSVAQSIITLVEFAPGAPAYLNVAQSVLSWAMRHMWDDRGFFYFQKRRYYTIRIPFMRWSQAWMLLALTRLAEAASEDKLEKAPLRFPLEDD